MQIEDGILVGWNPQRGFGHIQAAYGKLRMFAHVSALQEGEPVVGRWVRFDAAEDSYGRPIARTWWMMEPETPA